MQLNPNDFPPSKSKKPKCDYLERHYEHLFPLLLPSFSCLNVKEESIRFLWDKSFEKHLSQGDGLDVADCAEMMICCHHNFLMPYLLQEMHQNARRFADRETRKYGVECVCEEFTEDGMQGRYRMRLGDLWVLVRDLLGAAFFPELATYTEKGKKGERMFLTGIGLNVNKAMRPTARGVKWSSSTRDQFVIF